MNGTVTISIKDFEKLTKAENSASDKDMTRAAKELEVFLSFLITRENIKEYIEEFNRQATGAKINLVDGRAKIIFNDETN